MRINGASKAASVTYSICMLSVRMGGLAHCLCVLTFGILTIASAQNFDDFFDDAMVTQVINEAEVQMERVAQMRADEEAQPFSPEDMSANEVFRNLFKRTYPKAREIADSQMIFEWMVNKVDQMREWTGKPGEGIPSRVLERMLEASKCDQSMPTCSPITRTVRTITGECNDQSKPLEGAAFQPFSRIIPPGYEDGIAQPVGFLQTFNLNDPQPFSPPRPSARLISERIVRDVSAVESNATLMLMQWGQFIDHDFAYLIEASVLNPEEEECEGCRAIGECLPIQVPSDDISFGLNTANRANCLRFERSAGVCRPRIPGIFNPRDQLNQITMWLDGSMVYGSTNEEQQILREFRFGRLRESNDGNRFMPVDPTPRMPCLPPRPCFRGGDLRANEQVALTAMHTVFLRVHNNIADRLCYMNPQWTDEKLFQEARKIVIAIIESVTFYEYLPIMLGREVFDQFLGDYKGYNPALTGDLPNAFGAAAFRVGHSQIQPQLERLDSYWCSIGPLPLERAFFNPEEFILGGGTDPFIRGLLGTQSRKLDEFVTKVLTTKLFAINNENNIGTDLASLNIQRGRDHGLQSYRVFKNFCTNQFGLSSSFSTNSIRQSFQDLYNSEDDVDLWPAGLAEEPLPGSLLGATFTCIWLLAFEGMRGGDRFWYENPGVFTTGQLNELRKITLSKALCDGSDRIRQIQPNAFSTVEARKPCNTIPTFNLEEWREGSTPQCWVKIQIVSPRGTSGIARTVWRFTDSANTFQRGTRVTASPDGEEVKGSCVKFSCPVDNQAIIMAVNAFVRDRTITNKAILTNLPRDRSNSMRVYRGVFSRSFGFGPHTGIYKNLGSCNTGGNPQASPDTIDIHHGVAVKFTFA
nr:peroxidase-like protein 4 [Halisarca dujardinii]